MGITSLLRVDLQLAGIWTNITDHVLTNERITIRRGRGSETAGATPSSATLALDNRDGRFTPRNPAGTYYPNFARNTPIRIGIGVPPQGSGRGQQAASASIVAPATVAESAGLALAIWAQAGAGTITSAAGYTSQGSATGTVATMRVASKAIASAGAVAAATASSTVSAVSAAAQILIPGGAVSSSGSAITTAAANALSEYNGPQVGPFALAAGDVLVCLAMWSQDPRNAMVAPPGDDSPGAEWMLVADSGPTTAGSPRTAIWTRYANAAAAACTVKFPNWLVGYADAAVTVIKVTGATGWNPRFVGKCSDISTDSPDGFDVRATVTCGATLRAMGQGNPTPHSAPWRQAVATGAVGYWPLEGGTLSTVLPSPISGVPAASAFGGFAPGNNSVAYPFSDPLGTFTAGNVSGNVPAYATGANVAGGIFGLVALQASDAAALAKGAFLMAQTAGAIGTTRYVFIQYTTDTTATLVLFDEALNTLGTVGPITTSNILPPGAPTWFVHWKPNATNPTTQVDIQFGNIDAIAARASASAISTITTTIGPITTVWMGREPSGIFNFAKPFVAGHMGATTNVLNQGTFMTSDFIPNSFSFAAPAGWPGENRFERLLRLCQEQSVPLAMRNAANSITLGTGPEPLGSQLSATPLDLIAVAQATDTGELADARCGGLLYRSQADLSAQAPVATLDYSAAVIAAPLVPVDDDATTRNDVTVTQQLGPSARTAVATGTLGIAAVGDYPSSATVSVFRQSTDLARISEWMAHVGTVDEQRFPAVALPLEASSNVQVFSAIDIGQRVTISNTPVWMQPGPSEEIVIGLTETIGPIAEWTIVLATEPYAPYAVLQLDAGTGYAELDSHYLGLWPV